MAKVSLKTKVLLSMLSIIFVFGFSSAVFVFLQTRDNLEQRQTIDLAYLSAEIANSVNQFLSYGQILSASIADFDEIILYLQSESDQSSNTTQVLDLINKFKTDGVFEGIHIVDSSGTTLVSTESSFINKSFAKEKFFKTAISGQSVVDFIADSSVENLEHFVASPIMTDKGEILGALLMNFKPEIIFDLFELNDDFSTENVLSFSFMLTDENGLIVYTSDERKPFDDLNNLTNNKLADTDLSQITKTSVFNDIKTDNALSDSLVITPIKDFPFYIVSGVTKTSIIGSALRSSALFSGMVLIFYFIAAILIVFIISKFLSPLRVLNTTSKEIIKGNYSKKVQIKTNDEFKDLADSFNKMTDKLIRAKDTAEKKLVRRTKELEKINKFMVGRELKMIELKEEIKKLSPNKNNKTNEN